MVNVDLHTCHNREQDSGAALWAVQTQHCAAAVSQAAAPPDYNPGTNSLVHNWRPTNPAEVQHRPGTSALELEFPDVPKRQKLHIQGLSLSKRVSLFILNDS